MSKKWFIKPKYTIITKTVDEAQPAEPSVSSSQWIKCPSCEAIIYNEDLAQNHMVCATCGYHFKIEARNRIELIADEGSIEEFNEEATSKDPLEFSDASGKYPEKVKRAIEKTKVNEAIITARAKIEGVPFVLCVMNFDFLGGSMGTVVGEKIYQAILTAIDMHAPIVIFSTSGGARMHEGILSLMQMAKTSASLTLLSEHKLPFISVLTNPTTGGVTASFAMLGDVIISEPGALIGFAGPRVIEQTIRTKLPEGFQRAEFLEKHGFVDAIVDRREMKETLHTLFNFFMT